MRIFPSYKPLSPKKDPMRLQNNCFSCQLRNFPKQQKTKYVRWLLYSCFALAVLGHQGM